MSRCARRSKRGVKPSAIARQFGIVQFDARKALAPSGGTVEVFILDKVFEPPTPPFTPEEKKLVADVHVWQQAMNEEFARAA